MDADASPIFQEAQYFRPYRPIRKFGGRGIRRSGNRRAYSLKRDRAVEVTLHDGQSIMLGSQ